MNKNITKIDISTYTMLKITGFFVGIYFLYLIKDILIILFVALVLTSAIDPWVSYLQRKKIPRSLGVILIYSALISLVVLTFSLLTPALITQISGLAENLPSIMDKINQSLAGIRSYGDQYKVAEEVANYLSSLAANLRNFSFGFFSTIYDIFAGITSLVLVLVITFYMSVEDNSMRKIVNSLAPKAYQEYLIDLLHRMQNKIGLWLRGQLILSLIIFSLTFVGLSILGVKYALVLALVAGLTEFVPYLGPIIASIPAIFLAFTQSLNLAFFTALLYGVIQWTENNIVVPKLMQKMVGLNPIVSVVMLLVGFKLAGILGAILSIPVTTAAEVLLRDIFDKKVKIEIGD